MTPQTREQRLSTENERPFAPILNTKRLTLRPLEIADGTRMMTHDIARMTGSLMTPYMAEAGEFFILRQPSLERRGLLQNWVIEMGGKFAGVIGCFRPTDQSDWEIGYWLGAPFWGAGLASEAVECVQAEFRRVYADAELWGRVFTDNPASRRVLEKCGFKVTGTETGYCLERQAHVEGWRLRASFNAASLTNAPTDRRDRMESMIDEALRLDVREKADAA